jgi:hypothetical protein
LFSHSESKIVPLYDPIEIQQNNRVSDVDDYLKQQQNQQQLNNQHKINYLNDYFVLMEKYPNRINSKVILF